MKELQSSANSRRHWNLKSLQPYSLSTSVLTTLVDKQLVWISLCKVSPHTAQHDCITFGKRLAVYRFIFVVGRTVCELTLSSLSSLPFPFDIVLCKFSTFTVWLLLWVCWGLLLCAFVWSSESPYVFSYSHFISVPLYTSKYVSLIKFFHLKSCESWHSGPIKKILKVCLWGTFAGGDKE